MPNSALFLSLLSIGIAIIGTVGTVSFVIAFLGNRNRGLSEVQNNTITALQAQNAAQEKQIQALERKISQFERTLSTVQYTLKKRRKLRLEVDGGEAITLIDEQSGAEITVPIHTGSLEKTDKEAS